MAATTHYAIFETTAATFDETSVRKAYRKLAMRLHPDKNDDPAAKEAFQKVGEALQILTDIVKRAAYDASLRAPRKRAPMHSMPRSTWPGQKPSAPPTQSCGAGGTAHPGCGAHHGCGMNQEGVPPGMARSRVQCPSCKFGMQVNFPQNYGTTPVAYQVNCPQCKQNSRIEVQPMRMPTFPSSWSGHSANGARAGDTAAATGGAGGSGAGGADAMRQAAEAKSRLEVERKKKQLEKEKAEKVAAAKKEKAAKARAAAKKRAKEEAREARRAARRKRKAAFEETLRREKRSKLRQGLTEEEIAVWAEAQIPPPDSPSESESEAEEQGVDYGIGEDGKMGECHYCKDGGELLCCDGCEKVFHFECLVPPMRQADMPDGDWFCEYCTAKAAGAATNQPSAGD